MKLQFPHQATINRRRIGSGHKGIWKTIIGGLPMSWEAGEKRKRDGEGERMHLPET